MPEYKEEDLKRIWKTETEIYQAIAKICEVHGLRYYAAYGDVYDALSRFRQAAHAICWGDEACPDCAKNRYPIGESPTAQVSLEQGIPLLAQLPLDPALARECDTGVIELFNEDWMAPVMDAVASCPKRVIQE